MLRFITLFIMLFGAFSAHADDISSSNKTIEDHPLPESFLQELKQCQSVDGHEFKYKADCQKSPVADGYITIKGWQKDKCVISLDISDYCLTYARHHFISSIPQDMLEKITTGEQISALIDNLSVTDYDYKTADVYWRSWYGQLPGSLKFCNKVKPWSPKEMQVRQFGITWGTSYSFNSGQCVIDFVHQVRKGDKIKDMSITCTVPQQKIPSVLAPYQKDISWINGPDTMAMGDLALKTE